LSGIIVVTDIITLLQDNQNENISPMSPIFL